MSRSRHFAVDYWVVGLNEIKTMACFVDEPSNEIFAELIARRLLLTAGEIGIYHFVEQERPRASYNRRL